MKHRPLLLLMLALLTVIGIVEPIISAQAAVSWSSPLAIQQDDPYTNVLHSALQSSNGTVWLAWQTNRYRGDSLYDISYKTGILGTTGVSWSAPLRFTNNNGYNSGPSLVQLKNGTIALFWSYKAANSYDIYYARYNQASWSNNMQVTFTTLNDTNPAVTVTRDGTVWLAWTRTNSTCQSCSVDKQLYYKTMNPSGVWSNDVKLTSDLNWNMGPSILATKDGIIRVSWSKGDPQLANFQVYYKTFSGTSWSAETQIVTSTTVDQHPSLLQDRNGTLWLFWDREINVSPTQFYYAIFSKYSIDMGTTWTIETQLTNTPNTVDSWMPTAMQSANDKKLWVFYSTNPSSAYQIWALTTVNPISPVCDVGVYSFNPVYSPSNSLQYAGGLASIGQSPMLTINVTLANRGDAAEIVSLKLVISNTTSYTLSTTAYVNAGGLSSVLLKWNSTVKPARYAFQATVTILTPACTVTLGNQPDTVMSANNMVHILPLGDIDQEGAVSITDVSVFFYNYGFSVGNPRYNPYCDITGGGTINIVDVGVAVNNYGIVT